MSAHLGHLLSPLRQLRSALSPACLNPRCQKISEQAARIGIPVGALNISNEPLVWGFLWVPENSQTSRLCWEIPPCLKNSKQAARIGIPVGACCCTQRLCICLNSMAEARLPCAHMRTPSSPPSAWAPCSYPCLPFPQTSSSFHLLASMPAASQAASCLHAPELGHHPHLAGAPVAAAAPGVDARCAGAAAAAHARGCW